MDTRLLWWVFFCTLKTEMTQSSFFGTLGHIDLSQQKKHTADVKCVTEKEDADMKKIFFTIAGTCFYHGKDFFEKGMTVKLIKEPDNAYDKEAIKVELEGLGLVGYVANSPSTVIGESYSAGRIYDKIEDEAEGTVLYNVEGGVLCCLA